MQPFSLACNRARASSSTLAVTFSTASCLLIPQTRLALSSERKFVADNWRIAWPGQHDERFRGRPGSRATSVTCNPLRASPKRSPPLMRTHKTCQHQMSVLIAATMTAGCCIEPINQHYEGASRPVEGSFASSYTMPYFQAFPYHYKVRISRPSGRFFVVSNMVTPS